MNKFEPEEFLNQAIAGFGNEETDTLGINNIPSSDVTSEIIIPIQTTDDSDALLLPNYPSILNVSGLPGKDLLTGEVASEVAEQLQEFAAEPNFTDKMNLAFDDSWNVETANTITQQWLTGDFSQIPEIEVVSTDDIAGADGAFAGATESIYISQEWLELNASNPGAIASVVLEEIGHYVDSEINIVDATGDEGAIFSAVVRGEELSATEVARLKAEDDSAVAVIDGQEISIEKFDIENQWYVEAYPLENWKAFSYENTIDINNNFGSNTLSNGQKGFSGNWRKGSPKSAIPDDNFVLELFTQANFEAGKKYTFNVTSDDGYWIAALPVDGGDLEVITEPGKFSEAYGGNTHLFTPDTTEKYWIATIYYEQGGDAYFDLAWSAENEGENDSNINRDNFTGWAMPNVGVSLRNSTNHEDRSGLAEPYHKLLKFDAWTNGETVEDYQLDTPDSRWFRVAGTEYWVPSAYIYGNPDGNSVDSNDLKEDAQELYGGMLVDGEERKEFPSTIGGSNDLNDFYEFTLNNAREVDLSLTGKRSLNGSNFSQALQADADIYLYDRDGNFIAGSDGPGTSSEYIDNVDLDPGKYYIQVSNLTGNVTDYKVELSYITNNNVSPDPEPESGGYFPELRSLSDADWDEQTSDNTGFSDGWPDYFYDPNLASDEVEEIYADLNLDLFGTTTPYNMTAGYIDPGYFEGLDKWHAGIDIGATTGTEVKAVAPGTVQWVDGSFIGITSLSGNSQWVYGHLNVNNFSTGDQISKGDILGTVNSDNHLHFETRTPEGFGGTGGASPDKGFIQRATMSPLQAYWISRN